MEFDVKPIELREPFRSPDGLRVYFVESASEWRFHAVMYTATAIGLSVIGLLSYWLAGGSGDPAEIRELGLIFLVPAAFIVISAWMIWFRQRGKAPATKLVVGAEGLFLPLRMEVTVPWPAIDRLSMIEHYQRNHRLNVCLCVHIAGANSYSHRGSKVMRTLDRWYYGTELTLQLETLVGEPEDVLTALKEFAPPALTSELRLSG
jgi:hypothetical protein